MDSYTLTLMDVSLYIFFAGEIKGTVHADVLEEFGSSITSGSVMVLRRVSVLSPTPRRHYLSITLCNVVSLYTPSGVHLRGCVCTICVDVVFLM